MTYGWRLRIGLILPSCNTVMEPELYKMAPEGVSIHTARMRISKVTEEDLKNMAEDSPKAAEYLATADVDVILYGCTSGSFIGGIEWEREIVKKIEERTGIPTITTSKAVIDALQHLKLKKIIVATPYIDELNELEEKFLEKNGIKVLRIKGLGILRGVDIGSQPVWVSYRLAREIFTPEADGIFISCTNFRTIEIIEKLERDLKRPVITSNQASMWAALRAGHIKETIEGYGALLKS